MAGPLHVIGGTPRGAQIGSEPPVDQILVTARTNSDKAANRPSAFQIIADAPPSKRPNHLSTPIWRTC